MGRVDDAMRRAAGGAAPPAPENEVSALAAEPFPDENPVEPLPVAYIEPVATREIPTPPVDDPILEQTTPGVTVNGHTGSGFLFETLPTTLSRKVVTDSAMVPASREQYRKLAGALHAAQRTGSLKVVMIASAVAGEGKTLTATNLALTLSESYQRSVLVIDGDLRRPSIHQVFGFDGSPGLTECLATPDERRLPLHRVSERLTVLTAGRASSDPMAGLTSDRMHKLIAEAREVFDWVIIDTPPVGVLTDANLLAAMVDATLLVVKADTTPYYLVQRAVDAIDRERLFGVVLNQATRTTPAYGYQYYQAYYGNSSQVPQE
jgi:protein-tyrosine kinase